VLRALAGQGFALRALVRASSPRANFEGVDCEIVEGDMRDKVAMEGALEGARYLYHVAADYRLWARDPEDIVRANVEGTDTVMRAALTCGVERIVYTSSVATLRAADATTSVDETSPLDEGKVSAPTSAWRSDWSSAWSPNAACRR
jgi:dihydroflavonol-4-reductase